MNHRYQISISTKEQDDELAFHRHDIYAVELRQHETNRLERLGDSLDAYNINIVVCARGELAGFISLTPPNKRFQLINILNEATFLLQLMNLSGKLVS